MYFLYKFKTKQIFFTVITLEAIAIFLLMNTIFKTLSSQAKEQALNDMNTMISHVAYQVDSELQRIQNSTKIIADSYMRNYYLNKQNKNLDINEWKNKMIENNHVFSFYHDGINNPKTPHFQNMLTSFVDKKTPFDKEVLYSLEAGKNIKELMSGIYENYKYSFVYITTANNIVHIYPSVSLEYESAPANATTKHWYKAADFKNKTYGWEEPYKDLGGMGQMVTVSYPFYDNEDILKGVVSHDITIQQILSRFMKNIELYKNSTIILVSKTGKAISTNNQKYNDEIELENEDSYRGVLYYLSDEKFDKLKNKNNELTNSKYIELNDLSTNALNKLKQQNKYSFEYTKKSNDSEEILQVASTRIPTTDWIIIHAVPNTQILGKLSETNTKMQFSIAILLAILYFIVGLIYYFRFFLPISTISNLSDKVGKGELNHKLPTRYDGEIGQLFSNFSKMIENIKRAKKLLEKYNENLEKEVKKRTKEIDEKNRLLEDLAIKDNLTKLYNRNKLDEVLINESNRANRYNHSFGVILVDIDNFKSVNDVYGHQMGDKVLQEFANILQSNSRKTDTVGRWGGEEFLIICSETEFDGILTQAEKLKEKVENFDFSVKEQKTASFGVSLYNKNESVKDMIKRADDALYEAKVAGKNRVKYK